MRRLPLKFRYKIKDALEKNAKKSFKDAMEMWFDGLAPDLQKNLGGPVGSKKLMQKVSKNIDDVITTNFKIEESKDDISKLNGVDRWQKLAGIK